MNVILVNPADQVVGEMEKLAAHEQGLLHRAFSVFIFRDTDQGRELLLQQRANGKYHSGGLWTNTCCSHPQPGETTLAAGERRLMEEVGIRAQLSEVGSFIYKAAFDNGLSEHELDHVLIGEYDGALDLINPEEIQAIKWIKIDQLQQGLVDNPQNYTAWFAQALAIAVA